jgi:hypothetical protein
VLADPHQQEATARKHDGLIAKKKNDAPADPLPADRLGREREE